ncbi:branched-chain amino acid ABC transporter permease [Rhodobacter sp. 24-YEA-8]|uniref:branched-chain amino acid ABC transporter permease n=1 Tax=Rhodobacter sp. 24-YEA-8 TaxID=1884310 RepID=UPI000895D6BA|nr:branched-chain amino acid ABC transporter permease [Rhodobacter sp. 24-YEA-8]SEC21563.1 amino acid/amide ABC transporter membrane protein 2, HAAT family [Rhodobacter sp. 24-YEA-8]
MSLAVTAPARALFTGQRLSVLALLALAFLGVPAFASPWTIEAILLPFLALSLAGLGLNLLTGYAGQVSLGSAAFMAVGAYAAFNIQLRLGLPLPLTFLFAATTAAAVGVIFGLPSLRLRGFYLAVSTLAAQFFIQWLFNKFGWFSNYSASGVISAPVLSFAGITFDTRESRYLLALTTVTLITILVHRLVNGPARINLIAVRDNETAAKVIGVPVLRTKLAAFALSSAIIGVAGVLWSFTYLRTIEPEGFNLDRSFQILFIAIIGGLATIRGAFLGAGLIVVFPLLLSRGSAWIFDGGLDAGSVQLTQRILLGATIITFLILEPNGLSSILDRVTTRIRSLMGRT